MPLTKRSRLPSPENGQKKYDWKKIAEELREAPYQWHLIFIRDRRSLAVAIRSNGIKALPANEFQVATRKTSNPHRKPQTCTMYMRYAPGWKEASASTGLAEWEIGALNMYGIVARATRPIDTYEAVVAEVNKRLNDQPPEGAVLHVAYPTEQGFTVMEIWESEAKFQKFRDEVLDPAMQSAGLSRAEHTEWSEFTPHTVNITQKQSA